MWTYVQICILANVHFHSNTQILYMVLEYTGHIPL